MHKYQNLRGFWIMKSIVSSLTIFVGKLDSQKVRLIVLIGVLMLFVLAAGAPAATGGCGH
jgi:hypothetical protein